MLTGYNGFIGKHICERYNDVMYRVEQESCFDIFKDKSCWSKIDEIWHIGAISNTTETDIAKIYKYNIDFTIKLFEKAIQHKIPVKFASSASVYGSTVNENRCINPLNYYAFSKAIIDKWIEDNMDRFSKIQSYRFFNVYGEHEEHKFLNNQSSPVFSFIKNAKENGKIRLFENSCSYFRDFIHVDDVIDCMTYERESGIYDLGTSKPISFDEIGMAIAEKYNAKIEYFPFPDHLRGKYQTLTKALYIFTEHKFKTVEDYLSTVK